MKSYVKGLVVAVQFLAILTVGVMFGSSDVWSQEKDGTLGKQIQGNWTLVSIYNELEGKKTDVFGANPRGLMILTPEGRFSLIIMKASLPKFAANNRVKGTAEENQAVVEGSIGYFGSYQVTDDKEQKVGMKIEGSTFPNYDGQDQIRIMTITGDEMKVTNPTAGVGGTNYLVWKRAK